jgi:hypothetical protein
MKLGKTLFDQNDLVPCVQLWKIMEIIYFGISIGYFFSVKVKTVKTLILSLNGKKQEDTKSYFN